MVFGKEGQPVWSGWREEVTAEQVEKVLQADGSQGTERGQSSREGGAEAEGWAGPVEPLTIGHSGQVAVTGLRF